MMESVQACEIFSISLKWKKIKIIHPWSQYSGIIAINFRACFTKIFLWAYVFLYMALFLNSKVTENLNQDLQFLV